MGAIYREGWALLRRAFPLLVMIAAFLEGAFLVSGKSHAGFEVVMGASIAYALHRNVLFGERLDLWNRKNPDMPKPAMGRFLFLTLLLYAMVSLASLLIVYVSIMKLAASEAEATVISVLSILLTLLLILSVFGTALPAAAAREKFSFRATLRRARQTGWQVARRLIAGLPVILALCFLGVMTLDLLVHTVLPAGWVSGPVVNFVLSVLYRVAGLIPTVFAVVILCHAYLDTKEDTHVLQPA